MTEGTESLLGGSSASVPNRTVTCPCCGRTIGVFAHPAQDVEVIAGHRATEPHTPETPWCPGGGRCLMSDFSSPTNRAEREKDEALRCTSRFAGYRCTLRSGHSGVHEHDGAAGLIRWGDARGWSFPLPVAEARRIAALLIEVADRKETP